MLQAARNLRVEREKEHTLGRQKLEQKNQVINTRTILFLLSSIIGKQWCRHIGAMVSILDSGSSSLGLSPTQRHCVVFLACNLTVPFFTLVYNWVLVNAGGNLAVD